MSLKGKTAIVTGGERGIGRAITGKFLSLGMRVCIAGIDTAAAEATLRELDAGDRLMFVRTDVGDEPAVQAMVEATFAAYGGIDALVANAGLASPGHAPIGQVALADWDRVIRTNLTGPFLCAKHAWEHLRAARGAMVLIASTRALQSEPNGFAYSASKGGVVALTHALANSTGGEFRVNCISPGWIHLKDPQRLSAKDHAQHPAGRVGRPADIAAMAAYLISDEAGFITGQNFVVDGGMTRKMVYA